jgi:hypothetical protein
MRYRFRASAATLGGASLCTPMKTDCVYESAGRRMVKATLIFARAKLLF